MLNNKKLIALSSILINTIVAQSAWADTFAFSRDYDNCSQLFGQFKANDLDSNGEISTAEVINFEGTFCGGYAISLDEPKKINEFHHILGTNILNFSVTTTGRDPDPTDFLPFDSNWRVDFSDNNDQFRITDYIILGTDTLTTGKVEFLSSEPPIPSTPEGSNLVALIGLMGLSFWRRKF